MAAMQAARLLSVTDRRLARSLTQHTTSGRAQRSIVAQGTRVLLERQCPGIVALFAKPWRGCPACQK